MSSAPFHLQDLSGNNRARILRLLRGTGGLSRQDITAKSGLSWGGMTKIVNRLLEDGLLEEIAGTGLVGPGRKPHLIRLVKKNFLSVGLDVNLEGLHCVIVNLDGEVLSAVSRSLPVLSAFSLKQEILHLLSDAMGDFTSARFLTIGVAMQGSVNAAAGLSVTIPRIPDWHKVPVSQMIAEQTGLPVRLEHDPDCILSSLLKNDPASGALLLRIDSSIGMAVAINGHLLRGEGVLEIAHTIVNPDGPACPCGQKGCLDTYTSACLHNGCFHPDAAVRLVPLLARSLLNSVQLFNPSRVYLTGKLVRYLDQFESLFRDTVQTYPRLRNVDIRFLKEENRVALGAADLALEQLLNDGRL